MVSRRPLAILAAVTAGGLAMAAPAFAQPQLVAAAPTDGWQGRTITAITLGFSEKLAPELSGFEVMMTDMPGMAMSEPMKMNGVRAALTADGKGLGVTLARPLPVGGYELRWHAGNAAAQRLSGKISFTVRP